jgi:predicted nucleic acid-binding protein
MIVVSNTTPLSELAKVGKMYLLRDVFERVIIPVEVYDEVTTGNHPAVRQVRSANWIEVRVVSNPEAVVSLQMETGLDLGESAAIALAEELKAQRILIDELAGRVVAKTRNLSVTGTVGVLLIAKQQGLISKVQPILDELVVAGKRISPELYREVLASANE